MRQLLRRTLWVTAALAWAAGMSFGAWQLWKFDAVAGPPAQSPLTWPTDTTIARSPSLPTLVLLIHPQCPCSRATIGELARLMTDCHGKLTACVLVLRPDGVAPGWEETDLWRSAVEIPGVTVASDARGREAHRFAASTSGQALLYAADGRLLFSGGITESRGHSGDNAGRSALTALVLGADAGRVLRTTPVYGCPLFDDASGAKGQVCRR